MGTDVRLCNIRTLLYISLFHGFLITEFSGLAYGSTGDPNSRWMSRSSEGNCYEGKCVRTEECPLDSYSRHLPSAGENCGGHSSSPESWVCCMTLSLAEKIDDKLFSLLIAKLIGENPTALSSVEIDDELFSSSIPKLNGEDPTALSSVEIGDELFSSSIAKLIEENPTALPFSSWEDVTSSSWKDEVVPTTSLEQLVDDSVGHARLSHDDHHVSSSWKDEVGSSLEQHVNDSVDDAKLSYDAYHSPSSWKDEVEPLLESRVDDANGRPSTKSSKDDDDHTSPAWKNKVESATSRERHVKDAGHERSSYDDNHTSSSRRGEVVLVSSLMNHVGDDDDHLTTSSSWKDDALPATPLGRSVTDAVSHGRSLYDEHHTPSTWKDEVGPATSLERRVGQARSYDDHHYHDDHYHDDHHVEHHHDDHHHDDHHEHHHEDDHHHDDYHHDYDDDHHEQHPSFGHENHRTTRNQEMSSKPGLSLFPSGTSGDREATSPVLRVTSGSENDRHKPAHLVQDECYPGQCTKRNDCTSWDLVATQPVGSCRSRTGQEMNVCCRHVQKDGHNTGHRHVTTKPYKKTTTEYRNRFTVATATKPTSWLSKTPVTRSRDRYTVAPSLVTRILTVTKPSVSGSRFTTTSPVRRTTSKPANSAIHTGTGIPNIGN